MNNIGTIKKTLDILEKYQLKASKNYGQNFLVDENVIERIVESVDIQPRSCVIEVGPGIGALTQALAKKAEHVLAIDIDERMEAVLKETLKEEKNVEIRIQDFLTVDLLSLVESLYQNYQHIYIVSNLPYYITTALIEKMLTLPIHIDALVLMMQKEVAYKLVKSKEAKDRSALSYLMDYRGKKEYLFDISRHVFIPQPHVDSAVIKFYFNQQMIQDGFYPFLYQCFKQRRKTLYNNLKEILPPQEIEHSFALCQLDPKVRSEQVSLQDLLLLYQQICQSHIE